MKVGLFLILVLASAFAQSSPQWGSCGLCALVVSSLENYASKTLNKSELLNDLNFVSKEICPKIPVEFISPQQCSSFVSLYGPYTIDMILSRSQPEQICSELKLCAGSSDEIASYTIIYPTIESENERVTYTVTEKNVYKVGQDYRYRIFLGNPSFLSEDMMSVELSENEIADLSLVVTNLDHYTTQMDCHPQTYTTCSTLTVQPGRGVWYYITVTAKSFLSKNTTSFTLTATVQNQVVIESQGSFSSRRVALFPLLLPIIFIAICLCCCCRRRKQGKKMKDTTCKEVSVDMKEMMQPSTPVVGYYYPMAGQPQYMQVPMQHMPQPVFFPVAKPE